MQRKVDRKPVKTFSGLADIPLYPISFAKVLMQIGHEPLPPFQSTSIFGKEQLFYPNMLKYLGHIYAVEGITGLYRGLGMKLLHNFIGNQVFSLANQALDEMEKKEANDEELTAFNRFLKDTSREITTKCWALLFTQPFHVMTIRCMAQFVGGETKYSSWNVIQNCVVIYKDEGVTGFFSGLVPRILFEASTIGITSLITYLIKNYLFTEKELELFVDLIASTISTGITYPLSVTSTVTCVSGCGLLAGQPPRMVYYGSWIDALKNLYETNQLKRGGSMFFRLYNPTPVPTIPKDFKLNVANTVNNISKQAIAKK